MIKSFEFHSVKLPELEIQRYDTIINDINQGNISLLITVNSLQSYRIATALSYYTERNKGFSTSGLLGKISSQRQ